MKKAQVRPALLRGSMEGGTCRRHLTSERGVGDYFQYWHLVSSLVVQTWSAGSFFTSL